MLGLDVDDLEDKAFAKGVAQERKRLSSILNGEIDISIEMENLKSDNLYFREKINSLEEILNKKEVLFEGLLYEFQKIKEMILLPDVDAEISKHMKKIIKIGIFLQDLNGE